MQASRPHGEAGGIITWGGSSTRHRASTGAWSRGWQTLSTKGQEINSSGAVLHTVSLKTTQRCHRGGNAATTHTRMSAPPCQYFTNGN